MNIFLKKLKDIIKDNWPVLLIILISIVLHVMATEEVGFKYNINSDDVSYVMNGIEFFKTGHITMRGIITAQSMPGLTFLIAAVVLIFGTGTKLWVVLKILYMLMGITTIIILYKILRLYSNKYISAFPCLFFLAVDYIWMDNLVLTETPFIMLFSLLIYHTLKLSIDTNKKDFICILIYYIIAIYIRPNIIIYPIFLIVFLILKKYDLKLLIKQVLIAGIVVLAVLMPWTIRNYKVFGKFIPLTYGSGNPLLLGTYQGYGYPTDDEINYEKELYNKMSDEMRYYLLDNPNEKNYMTRYYTLEYDGMKAKYRMKKWWNSNKKSMLISYTILKPKELIFSGFYWHEILGISTQLLLLIRKIEIIMTLFSLLLILKSKKRIKEVLFIILVYLSQIAVYSYTFAFSRYAISLYFLRYIIIGFGLEATYDILKNRRYRSESIDYNTRVQRGTKYRKNSK